MKGQIIKRIIISILVSIITFALGCLLALLIAYCFHVKFKDVLFFGGIIITVISVYVSIEGSPKWPNITGLVNNNAQYIVNNNIEATKVGKESTASDQNHKKSFITKLAFSKLTFIFGGILLMLFGLIQ